MTEPTRASAWWVNIGRPYDSAKNKPVDGDMDKIRVVERCDSKWFYREGGLALQYGVPVRKDFLPTMYRWHGGAVPDWVRFSYYEFVSPHFRDILEQHEPDTHHFYPVTFVGARRAPLAEMFLLVPGKAIRCISKVSQFLEPIGWEDHWGDHIWHPQLGSRHARVIFDHKKIEGHHLWIPIDFWKTQWMVSDTLKRAIEKAGLSRFVFTPAEVDNALRWALPELRPSPFAKDPPWKQWLEEAD